MAPGGEHDAPGRVGARRARFGTLIAWFLLGGDLYTAYTFIAVPGAVRGRRVGFFAVPYTIIVFPIAMFFLPRMWSIARTTVTSPRPTSSAAGMGRASVAATAFTGILALLPYIALQLVGSRPCSTVMGVGTSSGNRYMKDLPLFIAFLCSRSTPTCPGCGPRR